MHLHRVGSVLLSATLLTAMAQHPGPEAAIRAARDRFNTAIARHDTTGLDTELAEDIRVITSRGQFLDGRAAYRNSLAQQIQARPGLVYLRSPARITVQPAWNTATEEGEWTGSWTNPDGRVTVQGTYVAHWRQVNGAWKLSAELFGLTKCAGGAYCGR